MRCIFTASVLMLMSTALHAQQEQQKPIVAGATITGTIYCADISRPARFAHISLVPARLDEAAIGQQVETALQKQLPQLQTQAGNAASQPSAQHLASMRASIRTSYVRQAQLTTEKSTSVAADVNGHYTLVGVVPGVYYLHVRLDGYADPLDQFTLDQLTSSDPDTARAISAVVQHITVTGSDEQHVDVRLERGVTFSGHILYDDGAPAVGWTVVAMPEAMLHRKPDSTAALGVNGPAGMRGTTDTDDLGNFRIRSLPPGTYGLAASIVDNLSTSAPGRYPNILRLAVYSGDTFLAGQAKTYNLTAGASRSDITLTVPLNKVHTIRGSVVAKFDGHRIGNGTIMVTSKDDPGFRSFTSFASDGSFELDGIPAGTYTLNTAGVSDTQTASALDSEGGTRTITHTYGQASLPVTVNDVDLDGITLTVPDDPQAALAAPSQ
jgi:hypothetical protein